MAKVRACTEADGTIQATLASILPVPERLLHWNYSFT
jgi:hypothetical protein